MSWVIDAVIRIYAILAIAPFLPFALVWGGVYVYRKEKKLATKRAMDVTTFALIGIVAALYNQLFQSTFGLYLLLLMFLLGFGVLGNLQQRAKGAFDVKRTLRAVWRIGFLGLSAAYILLMAVGITKNLW
ncbi:DUF3397 domain-containing protein [Paenibacillus sp.]|uniref:DUF3397 domain-containing protein n=1 Tax=Paenibacillus sp. TaxID=58172 RepID=UPI002D763C6B|nr:DUF3397 domain-containing protein [Paenibacillus sp.]HZG55901.1 DUF3397 domain-containing protein [Paenibacillus sp.]